jgi:ABC-2 type transport system permease protein
MDFSNGIRTEWLQPGSGPRVPSFAILPLYRYNPLLRYPIFMVPAIMVMMMAMICGFLPALNIVSEKESGTIEQINVTPVKRFTFILSKLLPYWAIGFVVLTICFGVAFFVYGLVPAGNVLTIYLFASVFVLAFSGFGLTISNFAGTVQQAMFMMFFFVITFIFLSGLYTPVANMPPWAQTISIFSPLKYFINVMRSVYLKGSDFGELATQFYALCGFAVFFNTLAVVTYRKSV